MPSPKVSIIMPVYNAEAFIKETIDSVLSQTFTDFELICIDDGSSDHTADVLHSIQDKRLRLIIHEHNQGVVGATNTGFAAARGKYLVMIDHDDLSFLDRIERQVAFLDAHPELDGCGGGHIILSHYKWVDNLRAKIKYSRNKLVPADIVACESIWGGSIFNPTVCMRHEVLSKIPSDWQHTQFGVGFDDEFYGALIRFGARFCILPDIVLRYRRHKNSLSLSSKEKARNARASNVLTALNDILPNASEEQKKLHVKICLRDKNLCPDDLEATQELLRAIIDAGKERFNIESLKIVAARHWSRVCALAGCYNLSAAWKAYYGFDILRPYVGSPLFLLYQWQKRKISHLLH